MRLDEIESVVNGVEISAGLIGLPQAQRPFGIMAHAGQTPSPPSGSVAIQAWIVSTRWPVFGFQAAMSSSRVF
jgi:hypothetical protein